MNILALLFILPLFEGLELPEWHMKPLGSHIKPEPVDETFSDSVISPREFANKYVLSRKPIVFRNIVKEWPAYRLWTDEYLKENYGNLEIRLEAKREKQGTIPKGDVCLGRDTLKTFLNDYIKGANKYAVSELPTPMWDDVFLPPPMACGEFLTSYVEIDLWINSDVGKKGKGGRSILHKDQFNTVNCVINGTKEWKLIELKYNDYVYQGWEGPIDANDGGFSLINPEKVDAREFPDIGKIPRWQFVKMNAGDCLYLPSQMWHQVKSYGVTNKAVAFLFSQFKTQNSINTMACDGSTQYVPLSQVDVDLKYPGHGMMTMGLQPIECNRGILMGLVDEETGIISRNNTYKLIYRTHSAGAIYESIINEKTDSLYKLLFKIASEDEEKMTVDLIRNLTRDQIRSMFFLVNVIEPASSCNHEYAYILPEEIVEIIDDVRGQSNGKIEKEKLMNAYEEFGGTRSFAESLWNRLAGDQLVVDAMSANMDGAIEPYEMYRRDKPNDEFDDDATMTTAEGHVSQPKSQRGGYEVRETYRNTKDEEKVGENGDGGKDNSFKTKEEL